MQTYFKWSWNNSLKRKLVLHLHQLVNSRCFTSLMTWTCPQEIHIILKVQLLFWDNTEIMNIGMIRLSLHWRTSSRLNLLLLWIQLLVHSSLIHVFKDISSCLLWVSLINPHCPQFTLHIWISISVNSRELFRNK